MSRHANLPFSVITVNTGDVFNNGSTPFTDLSALADNTIAFVKEDGTSVTAAALAADPNIRFKIVKVQKSGSKTWFDTSLNSIKRGKVRSIGVLPISTGRNQVVNVEATSLSCNSDYLLKFVLNAPNLYPEFGFQPRYESVSLNSGCCAPCEGCGESDCKEFWISYKDAINAWEGLQVTATLKAPTAKGVADDALSDTEVRALEDICPVLQLSFSPDDVATWCDIPDIYAYPNGVSVDVVGVAGFECNTTITTIQEMCFEQTTGTDLGERQFASEGYAGGGIFRRASSGARMGTSQSKVDVVKADNYVLISIEWDGVTEQGFQVYQNPGLTHIAINENELAGGSDGAALIAYLDTAFGIDIAGLTLSAACSSAVEFTPAACCVTGE